MRNERYLVFNASMFDRWLHLAKKCNFLIRT